MYARDEVAELIFNGENSFVEFKEDVIASDALAKEMVAFANSLGGRILLGVADTGAILGLRRFQSTQRLEEWVMQAARDSIRPPMVPAFQVIRSFQDGRDIAIITVARGLDVFARWKNNGLKYYIRAGSTSREASTEELQRLFQRRGKIRAELFPVVSASYSDFDERRLRQYFDAFRRQPLPDTQAEVVHRLCLVDFFTNDDVVGLHPNVAAIVLFAESPQRFIGGAAIDAVAFRDREPSASGVEEATLISGPAVRLQGVAPTELREPGIIETALDFVHRHAVRWNGIRGATRDEDHGIPEAALREAVVNAVVHRDYTLSSRTIQLRIFPDRIEIISPGRLPNGITVEGMELGARASRNQLIVDTMRDYRYVERLGLGVPEMIRTMRAYNGTAPQLEERDETFIVTLVR
jgi:ATP-dependent DNA helicase RecG